MVTSVHLKVNVKFSQPVQFLICTVQVVLEVTIATLLSQYHCDYVIVDIIRPR